MTGIVRVEWMYWVKNSKRRDRAHFKSLEAANKFVAGLTKEKKVEEVSILEGLTINDI